MQSPNTKVYKFITLEELTPSSPGTQNLCSTFISLTFLHDMSKLQIEYDSPYSIIVALDVTVYTSLETGA